MLPSEHGTAVASLLVGRDRGFEGAAVKAELFALKESKKPQVSEQARQSLQQVLDDWSYMAPQLQDLYHLLNSGKLEGV